MDYRRKLEGQSWRLIAAGVLLAMGTAPLTAQQPGSQEQPQQSQQQQQQQQPAERDDDFGRQQQDDPFAQEERERDIDVAAADTGVRGESLDQLAQEHGDLSTFVEAVKAAGMEDALMEGTAYTIFAPNNEAFEQAGGERLLQGENWEETAALLRAHIVADDVDREMARRIPRALTLDGGTIDLAEEQGELMADNARVVEEDIQLGNLRIHVIDSVLQASPGEIDVATREGEYQDEPLRDDEPRDGGFDDGGLDDGGFDDGGFEDDDFDDGRLR